MADAVTSTPKVEKDTVSKSGSEGSTQSDKGLKMADMRTPITSQQDDNLSECGSVRSNRTMRSSCSAASIEKYREAKARLEITKLRKEQLKRKQQLEQQKLMLEMKLQLQNVEDEEEQAQLETQIWEGEMKEEDVTGDRPDVTQVNNVSEEVTSSTLAVNNHDRAQADVADVSDIITFPSKSAGESVTPPAVASQSTSAVNDQASITKLCQALTLTMNIPKPDIKSFGGDPAEYWAFTTSFETNISSKMTDARTRLTYLVQFCRGKAKESIENCILMEPTAGYSAALEILRQQFGQPHLIMHALLRKVTNRGQIRQNDGSALWDLARDMRKCQITLSQLGYNADMNSSENLLKVQRLLPIHLQAAWAKKAQRTIESKQEPSFAQMTEFMEQNAKTASNMYGQNISKSFSPTSASQSSRAKSKTTTSKVTALSTNLGGNYLQEPKKNDNQIKCLCCSQPHKLGDCKIFTRKSYDERRQFIRDNKLCDNCFIPWHVARRCRFSSRCEIDGCTWKHHTLLHPPNAPVAQRKEQKGCDIAVSVKPEPVGTCTSTGAGRQVKENEHDKSGECHAGTSRQVALRILPVKVKHDGRELETCALLDEGSDVSLCCEELAEQLGIKGERSNFSLNTVGGTSKYYGMEVNLTVRSIKNDEELDLLRVRTVQTLPISRSVFPNQKDVKRWRHLDGIEFPRTDGRSVQVLIGGDVPEAFWVMEERRGGRKEPYAIRSLLGWTLVGPTSASFKKGAEGFNTTHTKLQDNQLLQQVQRFWEVDFGGSIMDNKRGDSVEDRKARCTMEDSARLVDGHYEIGLPWRRQTSDLPDNRALAEKRLGSLKKRLQRDDGLCQQYKETIDGYIQKGYARPVPPEAPKVEVGRKWYLPHHPVFHPQKLGKMRVVFDCAAKFRGTSLNDNLLQGPDFTNNLAGVLTRFRQETVALVADIEAMFHQVRVPARDRDALRFLWWPSHDMSREPTDFQMLVHLFGATSSPSCAGFALKKSADDHGADFREATVTAIRDNFYVDDLLVSVSSVEAGIDLASQLIDLLGKGGFRLRKWISNNREVLAAVPSSERASSVLDLDLNLDDLPIERTLGLRWNVEFDTFGFRTVLKERPATRRGILSVVSSLFDPLGFLAPFILPAKILLQDVCSRGLGWDEKVEGRENLRWRHWLDDLQRLEALTIDRCLKPREQDDSAVSQLHLFSDASERGYAAVAYLRTVDGSGKIHCSFIVGKARLCPKRSTSIPRLELTAAVLAVQLSKMVQEELRLPIADIVFWTDSTSVLQYIRNESRRFRTFVANRVARIQDATKESQWRYVDSEFNPADEGSRGLSADRMIKEGRWLKGPQFLMMNEDRWPKLPAVLQGTVPNIDILPVDDAFQNDPDVKRVVTQTVLVREKTKVDEFLTKYSSWNRLKRGVAWLLRFGHYLHIRCRGEAYDKILQQGTLSVEEYRSAERGVIRYVQRQAFPKEMDALRSSKQDPATDGKKSMRQRLSLHKLNPILMDGILRVGGRLRNAPIDQEMKHPIVLPSDHVVTKLIIVHHHSQVGHSGVGMTWSSLREKFWIIRGGATVRRAIGNCFECKRRNAPLRQQFMADLPAARVTPDKPPFTMVGVDYFGPIYVKQGRSHIKRYGCIFTCLAVRAVHLEVAHSLDTDAFINSLRRFIARRGKPQIIMSDNGTNFVGGERELRESLDDLNQRRVSDFLLQRGISWQFNPPAASHMGGVWERMIRSVRKILRSLLKEQVVSDEVLLTLMAEVEAILNARPLTPLSFDPGEDGPLTPNHLLLLRANPSLPPGLFKKEDAYIRRRWRQTQYLADQFWRRWMREYLPALQLRQKWTQREQNLQVGDLVLVADERVSRGHWPLGRVSQTYPDHEGNVRQVEVKTGSGYFRRPISKLCLLESANN